MSEIRTILTLAALALTSQPQPASAQDAIFSDGFESGDVTRWSSAVGVAVPPSACISGPAIPGLPEGDLGPAPGSPSDEITCVEITNDATALRGDEVAFSGIPVPRALDLRMTGELALVGPGERRLAAQLDVLSRWGGTVDDTTLPIRWLGVSVRPRVPAGTTAVYSLRRYPGLTAAADPFAATVTPQDGGYVVDTGLATFVLDPSSPALFERIDVDSDDDGAGRSTVYTHAPGAGPRLVFDSGGGDVVLSTADPGAVTVDPGSFEIVESGPVKVVVLLKGHFSAPGGASLCYAGPAPYERFGYTLVATFSRASRDVGLEWNVRNECSDAWGGSWTDDAVTVKQVSWEFPFDGLGTVTSYAAGPGSVLASAPGFGGLTLVEQRKGAGSPWRRRARVLRGAAVLGNAEALDRPLVALADAGLVVAASMPWMRFREPQALAADGKTLSLRLVSEELVVGEAKAVWGAARLRLLPRGLFAGTVEGRLETLRGELRDELERGLLVRAPRGHVNESRLFASLGTGAASPIKTKYLDVLNTFHHQTVDAGGQWDRARTFGSQLWPDTQWDPWLVDAPVDPADNSGSMNYWNPSGAELLELLRGGDPKWLWDFALPQSRLQMYAAYVNLGDHEHGNRNGVAATSGGTGEGHWHRSAFGSDDYSYNMGMPLAYVLRPSPMLSERFAQAGRMVVARYSIPWADQAQRELWVDEVDVTRQTVQHFDMLANCAEFVRGADGQACHDRLRELLDEIVHDNLAAGIVCQGDVASATTCGQPQKFMVNALMYHFFHRFYLNYGDVDGLLARALVNEPVNYYSTGMPKLGDGVTVDTGAEWAAILECTLTAGGTQVGACSWVQNGDGDLIWSNKPHSVALLLMAHELDPTVGLCQVARTALDDPTITVGWDDYVINDAGWWKGAAQMMQGMVFGVGIYDSCSDP